MEIIGLDKLKQAVARNPQKVIDEVGNFLARGMAVYNRAIIRNPWRMGASSGGSPVAHVNGGNLRDTHERSFSRWEAIIKPTASYAGYVHGLNGKKINSRGVQLRPWLDHAQASSQKEIDTLQNKLLENIVTDLSR